MGRMDKITKESVILARKKSPKRICFAAKNAKYLKKSESSSFAGTLNVPFGGGFKRLYRYDLKPNENDKYNLDSYWWSIKTQKEFDDIDRWVRDQRDRVFLRDCLYTSIAMSFNFADINEHRRTDIGELEHRAKQNHDLKAVRKLAEHCIDTIRNIPLYIKADMVCAIPPNPGKKFDCPSQVVAIVSKEIGKEDVTNHFSFGAKKRSITSTRLDKKWKALEDAEIKFNGDLTGKKIILIDDKYQSGTTIQYIAMKLQEAGADQVLGLCMVKTMGDSDNQREVES